MDLPPAAGRAAPALPPPAAGSRENLLYLDEATFRANFGRRPFRVGHRLAGHPLFSLPRLIALSRALPARQVEYNAGDLALHQDPRLTPRNGLSVEETIARIEDCRSWMVLKNVEADPEYRDLLHGCLAEVARLGHPLLRRVSLREGFVFISSPGAVTPYHMDPELNFLLQVRGRKRTHVFDPALVSEGELERFYSGAHRNLVFKGDYEETAEAFEISAGEGVHVPVTAPHWVRNGDEPSVSFSITVMTPATERRGTLYALNHARRQRGGDPASVGQSPWRDWARYNCYRALRRLGYDPLGTMARAKAQEF
jgi:hypothetical protein